MRAKDATQLSFAHLFAGLMQTSIYPSIYEGAQGSNDAAALWALSNVCSFAPARHEGHVSADGCPMNALPEHAFTAVGMKEEVGGAGHGFNYSREAMAT